MKRYSRTKPSLSLNSYLRNVLLSFAKAGYFQLSGTCKECPSGLESSANTDLISVSLCCQVDSLSSTCSFIYFSSVLKYSWFTMLCQFLLYNKVSHPYIYIHSLSYIIFHLGFSQETGYSSLCYTAGPHCLSILNVIVCIY